jgi:SAM-dependent methyltransferase
MAGHRARTDGIDDRINAVVGSGAALPFRNATFGAISHSDVLCCLPEKNAMLEECRRVATDGATMAFSVIAVARGLPGNDYRRAVDAGPPFVDAPKDYAELLSICGWRMTERVDVSDEYKSSLSALIEALDDSTELSVALGADVVREAGERRREQVDVINAGLLVRELFTAIAI